jgi:uncharacterized membrane protein
MPLLALTAGYIIVFFVGLLGLVVIWNIFTGKIDLRLLVSEKDGPASLSRFQFLIFTFVVGMCLLVLTLESGEFPKLDPNILGLMGISGGSYLVSKGIQRSKDENGGVEVKESHTISTKG